jgi:hypothetical protein
MTKAECKTLVFKIESEGFDYAVENWPPESDMIFDQYVGKYLESKEYLEEYITQLKQAYGIKEEDNDTA